MHSVWLLPVWPYVFIVAFLLCSEQESIASDDDRV